MTSTPIYNVDLVDNNSSSPPDDFSPMPSRWMRQFYSVVVPAFVAYCSLTMVVNMCVLLTFKWIKGPLSPTLRLTISLALSDVATSALLAFSYVYNSYLYNVHQIETNACIALTSEAVRMGGLITGTFHFLALAINHYIGAVYPFLYKKLLRPTIINSTIVLMWLVPPSAFLVSFACTPGQGYRTPDGSCTNIEFALKLKFRLPIFTLICTLLLTMCLLYVAVILVLHKSRQKFAPAAIAATAKRVADLSTTVTVDSRHTRMDKNCRLSIENDNRQNGAVCRRPSLRTRKHQQQLQRKRNTLLTTLLIWSTFFLAWFPVATIYVLSCDTCVYSPHKRYDFKAVFTVSTVAQFGILTKTLINPIIYAVRIPEIRGVLADLWTSCRRRRGGAGRAAPTTKPVAAKNRRRFDVEATNAATIILEVGGGNSCSSKNRRTSTKKDNKANGTGFCSDDDLDS